MQKPRPARLRPDEVSLAKKPVAFCRQGRGQARDDDPAAGARRVRRSPQSYSPHIGAVLIAAAFSGPDAPFIARLRSIESLLRSRRSMHKPMAQGK